LVFEENDEAANLALVAKIEEGEQTIKTYSEFNSGGSSKYEQIAWRSCRNVSRYIVVVIVRA
jgi:hypothetical protein